MFNNSVHTRHPCTYFPQWYPLEMLKFQYFQSSLPESIKYRQTTTNAVITLSRVVVVRLLDGSQERDILRAGIETAANKVLLGEK